MRPPRLPWPLPALLGWAAAWLCFAGLQQVWPQAAALAAACAVGTVASLLAQGWWRRGLVAIGFPLSAALTGAAAGLPAWAWLLPLALLLLVYPLNAWRDAPLFPTAHGTLQGMAALAPLPPGAAVLDAGCGLGDGLIALRRAYPEARLHGLEWSWPLRALCALRCPWARVRQGDIWHADWGAYQLVYLFQRPESMDCAFAKARAELAPGAWLVSLEFPVPGRKADAQWQLPGARAAWLYRMPGTPASEAEARRPARRRAGRPRP
ncbi:class I SAM-dependent methyltransferase [Pseudacidovorax intermedius]|uniref:Methyltransferase type 12 n=1 Tax=Pseudacidovorax intermedius TaxID=433924 RepID=A0A147H5F2_9BURK|nr:class I SAM-dependent methyltransferase [Pseudacidovorax intermedius]KTT25105.1 methyltransferase type 12 [Pseudacidovorax intermedius]